MTAKHTGPTTEDTATETGETADGGPVLDAADGAAERALAVSAGLVPGRRATAPVAGVVVDHEEKATGSAPEHADHPTVRAALYDVGGIVKARIGHAFGLDADSQRVRGILVAPRPRHEGHAQVWFLENGSPEWVSESVALRGVIDKLEAAGWAVERGSRALNITATEQVWRAADARRAAWAAYPAAHRFEPVTGDDGSALRGWTFATLRNGASWYGWVDKRGGSGRLWETCEQAAGEMEQSAASASQRPDTLVDQVGHISVLLVGNDLDLALRDLAVVAEARARQQNERGAKAAASQYRHCAHHLRQAAQVLIHGEEESGAYIEAACFHAREANVTAI